MRVLRFGLSVLVLFAMTVAVQAQSGTAKRECARPVQGAITRSEPEIDVVSGIDNHGRGANFGWRIMEGSECFNPATDCNRQSLILPLVEYDHDEGCSVTCEMTGNLR